MLHTNSSSAPIAGAWRACLLLVVALLVVADAKRLGIGFGNVDLSVFVPGDGEDERAGLPATLPAFVAEVAAALGWQNMYAPPTRATQPRRAHG